MRVQIFSDLHCDFQVVSPPPLAPDAQALIVAGDVREGIAHGMRWLRHAYGGRVPIVMVAGNHEYFRHVRPKERLAGAVAAAETGVTFLDDGVAVLGGIRFVGSTLWADYALYGVDRRDEMIEIARSRMMDHRRIAEAPGRFITPEEQLALHRIARAYLGARLAEPHDGPTVVVTHHGPHPLSLADKFRDDHLSAAFISDLSPLIERHQPALWVHGHTHVSLDYRVGRTRIVCNPHGYAHENPVFDPTLVVEV